MSESFPLAVIARYGLERCAIERQPGGLINATYLARDGGDVCAVIQRLHPIFEPQVNADIDAVTAHLARCQLVTPRVLRTRDDQLWVRDAAGAVWRALSYIDGQTLHRMPSPIVAAAAGELVGRFHRACSTLSHEFAFRRPEFHDTDGYLARLARAVDSVDTGESADRTLAVDIVAHTGSLPRAQGLVRRICHGDLKVSNVRFSIDDPPRALCLIDLDTLGQLTIDYELGDALRSWTNTAGEDTIEPTLDVELFGAAVSGYARGARGLLSADEVAAIVPGVALVCGELAARFCLDIFEDHYFGWDDTIYASRRAHNRVRARGQLALSRSVLAAQRELSERVTGAFARVAS